MTKTSFLRYEVAFALLGSVLLGCGGSGETLHSVSGKVTFQGTPVVAGAIRFSNPQTGIDMTADLHPDGTYQVVMARGAGLPEGLYQVAVLPSYVDLPIGPVLQPGKAPEHPDIPPKYRQPATSNLTLTVKPGGNLFDVDMQP
jgi:hypothetical protein